MGKTGKDKQQISDNDLLQRHLDGDPGAFEALVSRYRGELYGFLARFTGNAALAEDVFQDAFLQLHISAATFDMSRRLRPWLFTIAANKARDALRSRSRRHAAPLDAPIAGDEEGRSSYVDLIPADIPSPDAASVNLEIRMAVQDIVAQMPEPQRVVVLLCYFQEMPYKDIAEALDIPLGTVKSRLHAALKHFGQKWKAVADRLGYDERDT